LPIVLTIKPASKKNFSQFNSVFFNEEKVSSYMFLLKQYPIPLSYGALILESEAMSPVN